MRQILIFTDLDGTLLDHHSYSFAEALPALNRVRTLGIPLILTTSKTAAELKVLRRELDNSHPFIVENGATIFSPKNYFSRSEYAQDRNAIEELSAHFFGRDYATLINIVHRLRAQQGYRFRGFADLSVTEVAAKTGLSQDSALLAKSRAGSEPICWDDSPEKLQQFSDELARYQLQLAKGGRFYHVLPQVDKGQAVEWLCNKYQQANPDAELYRIALGDGLNDLPMLETVDLAVILPSAAGDRVEPASVLTMHMAEPGPTGWNRAINDILEELQL